MPAIGGIELLLRSLSLHATSASRTIQTDTARFIRSSSTLQKQGACRSNPLDSLESRFASRCTQSRSSRSPPREAHLRELPVEGPLRDPQALRGLRDVAAFRVERLADLLLVLDLAMRAERHDARRRFDRRGRER